jgi:hypothetical protein
MILSVLEMFLGWFSWLLVQMKTVSGVMVEEDAFLQDEISGMGNTGILTQ